MFEGMSSTEILKLVSPLIVFQLALMIFCLYRIRKDEVRFFPKWVWVLIVIFINTVGPIVYIAFGRERD